MGEVERWTRTASSLVKEYRKDKTWKELRNCPEGGKKGFVEEKVHVVLYLFSTFMYYKKSILFALILAISVLSELSATCIACIVWLSG